jgi:hypothetical protein
MKSGRSMRQTAGRPAVRGDGLVPGGGRVGCGGSAAGQRPAGRSCRQPAELCASGHPHRRRAALAALVHDGHLRRHLRRRVRRDVLFHREAPQVGGPQGAGAAEPIWVELGWTIVPLLIVIGMALPATKVLVAQKDTTNADLTIKATGMQWKWGYDYIKGEGEGIGFLSTLDNSHRVMSNSGKPEAVDNYLLKVDNPHGGAGGQEDPHHHHRQRRDPRLDGAGFRRQAGRHPRFRARHLVPCRKDRRLLRTVRRAVRQGACLHAHPREGGDRRGIQRLGG